MTILRKIPIRLISSLLLLCVVLVVVDFGNLWTVLTRMSLPGAIAISLIYTFGQVVSALKWMLFIPPSLFPKRRSMVLRAYFFGMFVNTFGLGTIGGDMTRALLLRPKKGQRATAIASVLADRVHGLLVLLSIGVIAILYVRPAVLEPYVQALSSPLVVLLAALALLLGVGVLLWLKSRQRLTESVLVQKLRDVFAALSLKPTLVIKATCLSVIVHSAQILMHLVIARDLHTGLSLAFLFAVVPLVNIASSLPISVNGIGVREALYLLFLVPQGVSPEVAVAFGAIWLVSVSLVSALGGLLLPPEIKRELKDFDWGREDLELAVSTHAG